MPKIDKTCEVCGEAFSVWPSRMHSAKTCSHACAGKLTAGKYAQARIKLDCAYCGKEFSFPKYQDGTRQCCSLECKAKIDSLRCYPKGKDCPNWNGGATAHSEGYLYLFAEGHPFASTGAYVFEHRLVMEDWMRSEVPEHHFLIDVGGKLYLRPNIHVHHHNENKRDNSRKNLLACTVASHRLIHHGQMPMQEEVWPDIVGAVPYQPMQVEVTCEQCGALFKKKRSLVAKKNVRFCTRACYQNSFKNRNQI